MFNKFFGIWKLAFSNAMPRVRITPSYVEVDRSLPSAWPSKEIDPPVALTSRGSVALSNLPVLSDEDIADLRKEVGNYDFSPHN